MAFDGVFLHKIANELNSAVDTHIDKIHQPSKDELVFVLRKKGFMKKLLITVKPGNSRIHFTENKYENPLTPPNFCMLLRKYLSSAKLIYVNQPSLERIVELVFSATNEMGDIIKLTLICEFIGNKSNVILVNDNGKIIDALRHSDVENSERLILPGAVYEYPAKPDKLNPLTSKTEEILDNINSNVSSSLLKKVEGFSPLICREIEYRAETLGIHSAYNQVFKEIFESNTPYLVLTPDSNLFDFCSCRITQYGKDYVNQSFSTFSQLLDEFFKAKDIAARIQGSAHDIIKLVNNLIARTEKKLANRLIELEKCKDRENFRIYGELIKANLHNIKSGSEFCEVVNYYDENLNTVKIPLNPALSPSKNADKYFKDYKKTYTAEQQLTKLTQNDREELVYLDSVIDSINRSTTLSEINEIREELSISGYLKKRDTKKPLKQKISEFIEEKSIEGYRILIGKNNIQNDYITTKIASKNDLWFHTKNIPGSHVVVLCEGKEVSDETIILAATLAAKNSKAANGEKVPVDYTAVRFVKKPSGAKPGMVIYTTNKTVFVTPTLT